MATLAERLRGVVYKGRSIAGAKGFHLYAFYFLVDSYEDGAFVTTTKVLLAEARSQAPRMKQVRYQDLAIGATPPDIIDIGPVTPIGTNKSIIESWLQPVLDGDVRHILRVDAGNPDGKRYRVLSISTEKALRYMIRAQSEAEALQGYTGSL